MVRLKYIQTMSELELLACSGKEGSCDKVGRIVHDLKKNDIYLLWKEVMSLNLSWAVVQLWIYQEYNFNVRIPRIQKELRKKGVHSRGEVV